MVIFAKNAKNGQNRQKPGFGPPPGGVKNTLFRGPNYLAEKGARAALAILFFEMWSRKKAFDKGKNDHFWPFLAIFDPPKGPSVGYPRSVKFRSKLNHSPV
jgi:hypothetical protein